MTRKTILLALISVAVMLSAGLLYAEDVSHGGDILYTEPVKSVIFSHKFHVEDLGMGCDMCHDGLFEMSAKAAEKSKDFTMKGLYEGKFCGKCHSDSGGAFASNTQCARCHVGVKGYNKAMGVSAAPKH